MAKYEYLASLLDSNHLLNELLQNLFPMALNYQLFFYSVEQLEGMGSTNQRKKILKMESQNFLVLPVSRIACNMSSQLKFTLQHS